MHDGDTHVIFFRIHIVADQSVCHVLQFRLRIAFTVSNTGKHILIKKRCAVIMEQACFKLNAIRRQRKRIAGIGKLKGLEITANQHIDGIRVRNIQGWILRNGIGKRDDTAGGSDNRAAVTDLEINHTVVLDSKDLNGGREFIKLLDLNGSADQDLDIFLFLCNGRNMADHRLMEGDECLASLIEFCVIKLFKIFRKVFRGKFRDIDCADMGKRSTARTVAQCHRVHAALFAGSVSIVGTRQIVLLRIFAILSNFPSSVHVCLPIS